MRARRVLGVLLAFAGSGLLGFAAARAIHILTGAY
ncbi:MAG: hypothetical protein QOK05_1211 [Chloroflexota bacterium]|jgi:hypothetical protein|nr:hypothetical protein [Chloroflexota bacterium]